MPTTLNSRTLLATIPVADDGELIGADYHNSLRDALGEVASAVGEDRLASRTVVSAVPALRSLDGWAVWRFEVAGVAEAPEAETGGWTQLDLPNGLRIDEFAVLGELPVHDGFNLSVKLLRREFSSGLAVDVAAAELGERRPNPGPFREVVPFNPDLTPAQLDGLLRIDTARYAYLAEVILGFINADGDSTVRLRGFQATCVRD
jgi:hypothetical protein